MFNYSQVKRRKKLFVNKIIRKYLFCFIDGFCKNCSKDENLCFRSTYSVMDKLFQNEHTCESKSTAIHQSLLFDI